MKNVIQKGAYVVLGVLLTICVMLIINKYKEGKTEQLTASNEQEPSTITEIIPIEEASTPDYETEVEERLQQLQDTKTDSSTTNTATVSANSIEGAKVKWIKDYPKVTAKMLLEDKQLTRSSYEETLATNAFDKKVIENSTVDFSNVKISIMGDSICAASNLSEEEQKKYNIPTLLKDILNAKEVNNFAIGGSTISRATNSYAMVDRWNDIPMDSDIIIVFGGTNDCLFENKWQYGILEYENRMESGTFCGDLDEMVGGMQYTYRENNKDSYIKMIFVNPPSTVLNDSVYNTDPGNMVHQSEFAAAIREIAPNYGFDLIDMYNNNLFNTHDSDIVANFMPDGVHANPTGYQMIAEHLASEIIQRIEQ